MSVVFLTNASVLLFTFAWRIHQSRFLALLLLLLLLLLLPLLLPLFLLLSCQFQAALI